MTWLKELWNYNLFYISQYIYWFVYYIPNDAENLQALFFKCLPMFCLIWTVGRRQWPKKEVEFCSRIMWGLLFSTLGDALLVFESLFLPGMIAFALGHIYFISAFG